MMEVLQSNQPFLRGIRMLWSAEKMLTETMPTLIEKASLLGLKKNLALHLAETDQQKVGLEAICKQLGISPEGETNEDLKKILQDGQTAMGSETPGTALDAAIIASALKVEVYELTNYEIVAKQVEAAGYPAIAKRLYHSFEEERQAHTKLRFLEKTFIHETAALGE